jgi:hypothetical protein
MALKSFTETLSDSQNALREHVSAVFGELEKQLASLLPVEKPLSVRLNQISRCMRQAENIDQWLQAVIDGAAGFCARAALFAVDGKLLNCRATRGVPLIAEPVPMEAAPALASAVESQDTVATVLTAGEISKAVADAFAGSGHGKAYLIPLIGRKRCLAVLCAEAATDLDALELLMVVAAAAREHLQAAAPTLGIAAAPSAPVASANELRARRYAQARIAEMRLSQADAIAAGREQRNLYSRLRTQIDAARESYVHEFGGRGHTDYLHLEILRALANDDAATLGSEYPGPLV